VPTAWLVLESRRALGQSSGELGIPGKRGRRTRMPLDWMKGQGRRPGAAFVGVDGFVRPFLPV
jgi:hypothetical protein